MTSARQYCAVHGCRSQKTNRGLSFFKLPADEERRNEWLRMIGRCDLVDRCDLKFQSHIVCSLHFDEDMIVSRPHLRPVARPTRHLPPPADLPDVAEASCQTELTYLGSARKKKKKTHNHKTDTSQHSQLEDIMINKTDTPQHSQLEDIIIVKIESEVTETAVSPAVVPVVEGRKRKNTEDEAKDSGFVVEVYGRGARR